MGLKDYAAWLSVVHDTPAQARVAGSWLSVVHDTPAQARVAGSWLSVVHDDVPAPTPGVGGLRYFPRGRGPLAGPLKAIT